jgi:hypothetical protein
MRLATIDIRRNPRTLVLEMPEYGQPSEDKYADEKPSSLPQIGFTQYDPDKLAPVLAASRLISEMQASLSASITQKQLDIQRLEHIREGLAEHYQKMRDEMQ